MIIDNQDPQAYWYPVKLEPHPHPIDPANPEKRLRVLKGWLKEDVINDLSLKNYQFHSITFLRQCNFFLARFPSYKAEIDELKKVFWSEFQQRYKLISRDL